MARLWGVDGSAAMLARAQPHPRITWMQQDLRDWRAEVPADLLFSNAALQWLPDHACLFPALLASLAAGGILAVQMPCNFQEPSHRLMAATALEGPWRARLEGLIRTAPVGKPSFYHALLAPQADSIDIWQTRYLHVLEGADPVKEWTKGTWLKPLLDALQEPQRAAFEADYAARVRAAYPPQPDGHTLFEFNRLFLVARKR